MSFTTRSGRQAGRQQTQLTYHQPPRQQQNQAGYQPHFQQYPLTQPAPPGATSPLPALQQQQTPPQQQNTQQFKTQQQVTIKTESGSTPTKPTPAAASPALVNQIPVPPPPSAGLGQSQQTEITEAGDSKPWKKHKNPSFKVNKVLKRRRQNARFRKLLIPKNAIMVLNELQPGIIFEADEQTNAFSQLSYTVKINIDGVTYTGEGSSKAAAKAAAAEHAVKGLILKKITESGAKKPEEEEMPMDANSGDDASEKGAINGRRFIPEDEVPWGSLASFALFKLFADWKAQGTAIPQVMTPPVAKPIPEVPGPKTSPAPSKPTIPENPETMHPVTIVNRMYPGTSFTEISREGNPPHLTFCMGSTVNGVKYTGTARSKKEAKKNCAIEILKEANVSYNINL